MQQPPKRLGPPVRAQGLLLVQDVARSNRVGDVYLVNVGTGDVRRLIRAADASPLVGGPQWSPDGRRVLASIPAHGTADLWSFSIRGGGATRITRTSGRDTFGRWSPDGLQVAFVLQHGERVLSDLYVTSASGGPARLLSRNAEGLAWSPDGSALAVVPSFESMRPWRKPFVIPLRGGRSRPLGCDGADDILWPATDTVVCSFFGVNVPGGQTLLQNGVAHEVAPGWDEVNGAWYRQALADGSLVVTIDRGTHFDVYFVRNGRRRRIGWLPDTAAGPVWSGDGRYVAFLKYASRSIGSPSHLYIARGDGSGQRRLPVPLDHIEFVSWQSRPSP